MDVNQKIEQALSDLVNGNIWPLACPLEVPPGEFIVYLPEEEIPEEFGDDEELEWVHHMEVNWYKKGVSGVPEKKDSRKPVNYMKKRKQIRSALKKMGFSISKIVPMYEKDTGYTHLVFLCSIEEEDPYGEV